MSVIIRLQNLPWSANALDIRNYFRGLSIPEGGVHIVGGELGDAFIAFSTDEDARQAMMLDGGKIKEIQVKLLLSSRSEMHKVIEAARQNVPLLNINAPAASPAPTPAAPAAPVITPFSAALGTGISTFGIPGIGNPQEIPQPAVIEPPAPIISPPAKSPVEEEKDEDTKSDRKRSKEKDRRRTRSRSRSRDRKDRKRDRRDRSRSRDRRRRDRSRSRERRDRKRERKDRSRSRDRSPSRRSRDKRNGDRKSPQGSMDRSQESSLDNSLSNSTPPFGGLLNSNGPQMGMILPNSAMSNLQLGQGDLTQTRFNDPSLAEAFNKLQELGKKRNPNAFQGEQQNGSKFSSGRGGSSSSRNQFRREGRSTRFEDQQRDCCVAIRNAPNHTSYGDVRRFFPFMIDKRGIKMINDNMGRRTGNIFVRFCDSRAKQLALQRKPNELKGAQVIVESLDDDTYDAATDSFLPYREDNDEEESTLTVSDTGDDNKTQFSVLKLIDLPHFVQEQDIMKAFSDFSLLSIQLVDCRHNRTKNAYVEFVKPDDAKIALERKDSYVFGRRHPAITPLTDEEYKNDKNENSDVSGKSQSSKNSLQEQAVPRDPRQRRLLDNGLGGPQMHNAQQPFFPNTAFAQNFRSPFPNPQFGGFGGMDHRGLIQNWGNRMNFPNKSDVQSSSQAISLNIDEESLDCVLMKGLPREATDRTIVNFLSDTGAVPARIHLMLDNNGLPSGDCFCEFRTSQEARQASTKHGSLLDGCRVTVDLVLRSVVEEALEGPKDTNQGTQEGLLGPPPPFVNVPRMPFFPNRGQFRGRGFDRGGFDRGGFMNRGGFDPRGRGMMRGRGGWPDRGRGFDPRGRGRGFMRAPAPRDDEPDPALEDFGTPGCVLSMENVPFRATIDDILAFFSDFELTQDDVIRRYNERGQPTGDARVSFRTPFDAKRAQSSHNLSSIFDRRITLTLL
ncbi:RNA-binding protein 12 [Danaus plexippus]|uniref:RNA-binding protein 12 n=1 Tax=Danaus plexippus TaxID=13037 RepID=UPI0013C42B89|nr:RNA-binding protein 12 [Danaus plexippus]